MNASQFCDLLKFHRLTFAAGVPCTILKDIIIHLSSSPDFTYISATREDEAMGIATGAYLSGKRPFVLMQNSGLGNSVNALASLDILYRIPILMLISWRGYEGRDAPEHLVIGRTLLDVLRVLDIPAYVAEKDDPAAALGQAVEALDKGGKPVAMVLRGGILD